MSASEENRQLWTAWCDYFATGEGRSIMACVAYASSAEEMKKRFIEKFDDWFGKGCDRLKEAAARIVTTSESS